MLIIIGFVVVAAAIASGYMLEHGHLAVLFQPAELLIIGGAAIGSFIIASPKKVILHVIRNLAFVLKGREGGKDFHLKLLGLLYELFGKMRKEGLLSIEQEVAKPQESAIFKKYPEVLDDQPLLDFICDNIKVMVTVSMPANEIDTLMDIDIESHHELEMIPSLSVSRIADSLPGLGIVAAVLGVVITMGKINEPPEVLGHSVGAALVGTFLGILMCYGFIGPIGSRLEHMANDAAVSFKMTKVALITFIQTTSPMISVEFGRRVASGRERPTFSELENTLKKKQV